MANMFTFIRARIIRYFLAGLFAVLPLAITIAIVAWVADFLNRFVGPGTVAGGYVRSFGYPFVTHGTLAYALGFVLVLAAVILFGVIIENGARRWLRALLDSTLTRVPLLGKIYQTTVQLLSMLRSGEDDRLKGMSVVLCRFGGGDATWVLALAPSSECVTMGDGRFRAVLIPTAPIPFGGALLFLPEDAVVSAGVSLDEFVSVYMSMGVTMPAELPFTSGLAQDVGNKPAGD
jgi:uncharacterized membrane protein